MKALAMAALAAILMLGGVLPVTSANWPQWRYDAGRTADSPERLGTNLTLRWAWQFPPRTPTWEDPLNQDLMPFDVVFEPIVVGQHLIVGFNDRDRVIGVDIRTGQQAWVFYTEGPVRLPPAAQNGKVYVVSDDGWLYCISAAEGKLHWKFRGGPSPRKALGNSRLVSAWPARGGPVIRDNVVYFAASIWPFMGVFIYALEAETGEVRWVNDSNGPMYMKQPHAAPAFGGVAPQGALVATAKHLLVPGGRSVPAVFDRQSGDFLYYHLTESGKGTGGSLVLANDQEFFVHTRKRGTRAHELATGKRSSFILNEPVLGRGHYYTASDYPSNLMAVVTAEQNLEAAEYNAIKARKDFEDALETGDRMAIRSASNTLASMERRLGRAITNLAHARTNLPAGSIPKVIQAWRADNKTLVWEIEADGSGDLIRAGGVLYAAGSNQLQAIAPPAGRNPARVIWSHPVTNQIRRLLAAQGMLFAVGLEGHILAFGTGGGPPQILHETPELLTLTPEAVARAKSILERTGIKDGYAFYLGLAQPDVPAALAAASELHVIVVDSDTNKVEQLRRQWDKAGWLGKRLALVAADPLNFGAPPYIANLVVVEPALAQQLARTATPAVNAEVAGVLSGGLALGAATPCDLAKVYDSVRPYGGILWLSGAAPLAGTVRTAALSQAVLRAEGEDLCLVREGPLPGSADWTHQYGDVANSVKSDDKTVRLPVGVLWFGGNTHLDVLPRHGHGPSQQVAGGRLFIEGMDCISARDVYTGRRLWKTVIPGLDTSGIYYDETLKDDPFTTLYNQRHIPGANARGANFVVTADRVYVAVSNHCTVLDAATGQILQDIPMPGLRGQKSGQWTYIGVYEDILLGGTDFALFNRRFGGPRLSWPPPPTDLAACQGLTAFDRHTGKVLWQVEAKYSFIHNGIVAGKGKVYCLDRWPKSVEARLRAQQQPVPASYRIVAFDLRTGQMAWEQDDIVSCSWLAYSKSEDLLLLAGAKATDRLRDETSSSMQVLQAADGKSLWARRNDFPHNGPCVLYHDLIITTPVSYQTSAGAYRLRDGKPHEILNPLTGLPQPWKVYRTYGCNTPIAGEYLMTFRSGAAGFYDLERHSGLGNWGGFKSGCSANLIIANGVVNAPDYTRTCSCPYQNQTSLALVPMPELEVWTCNLSGLTLTNSVRIARLGLNLGAPGDRLAEDGTLWLEYPPTSELSPKVLVSFNGAGVTNVFTNAPVFRRHVSSVSGNSHPYVFASGLREVESLVITPQTVPARLPARPSSSEDDDDDDDPTRGSGASTNQTGLTPPNNSTSDTNNPALASAATNRPPGFRPPGPPPPGRFRPGSRSSSTNAPAQIHSSADLPELEPVRYTVRLYFSEPDEIAVGQRVFDIEIQGQKVLEKLDLIQETGEPFRGVVKEFKGISVTKDLAIHLRPAPGSPLKPVLSGVELLQEN
ncbi:MAG: PQQ-binding-like beta-propeller repeat protein [Verrucomicrobiae bacterium]|nr:PQQ-binding-like beta-propeller repeat protein [Verrucomicrobiae bacterium]